MTINDSSTLTGIDAKLVKPGFGYIMSYLNVPQNYAVAMSHPSCNRYIHFGGTKMKANSTATSGGLRMCWWRTKIK